MLAGLDDSELGRAHAEELLAAAAAEKRADRQRRSTGRARRLRGRERVAGRGTLARMRARHAATSPTLRRAAGRDPAWRRRRPPDQDRAGRGCARATSRSSTTSTSTGSRPTRWSPPGSPAVVNASAVHLRPLPEPRARDPARRRHPAARRRRRRGLRAVKEGDRVRIERRHCPRRRGPGRQGRLQPGHRRPPRLMDEAQRGPVGPARGVRRQHDGVHEAGADAAARRRRRARRCGPRSRAGTCWSSSAATTTAPTWTRCATTSASTGRC